ncbi:MAG: class I SAM-dependent methyltransferase [Thermoleophilaceae bacterium]
MGTRHGSTVEWRQIARGPRPLYHVLTWHDIEDWAPQDFYAVGESDWQDFRSQWQHYAGDLGGSCLEIGCGAGRITRMLAREFGRVEALDVSADMLEKARAAAPDNARFHQVDGADIPLPDASVDAVFSVHVFQHLEDKQMVGRYLSEAARVLAPGGTIMVHIPLGADRHGRLDGLRRELRLWRSRRALRRGREHFAVRYLEYPWQDVWRLFAERGFERIETRVFPVRSNGYHHAFWLATSP